MSRPKKTIPPAKSYQLTLRLTQVQYETLTQAAKDARLPRTEYIRQLITNRKPTIRQEIVFDSEELLHAIGDLGKIGSNLNQIAHHLNGGLEWNDNLKSEVYQGIIAIYKIRDMVRDLAGEYRNPKEDNIKDE